MLVVLEKNRKHQKLLISKIAHLLDNFTHFAADLKIVVLCPLTAVDCVCADFVIKPINDPKYPIAYTP